VVGFWSLHGVTKERFSKEKEIVLGDILEA
jgi:hypothetical protein